VLVRANELTIISVNVMASPLQELIEDERLLENHLVNLFDDKRRNRAKSIRIWRLRVQRSRMPKASMRRSAI
jgi:hypothetical protein